ncbi:MAG TPA: thioesterase, partial [Pseudomonas sp.]|nr:thioesterase [Pseudomonas sp.]
MGVELLLKARVEGEVARKSRVICEVWADGVLTVRADSVFVRVDTDKLQRQAHARA